MAQISEYDVHIGVKSDRVRDVEQMFPAGVVEQFGTATENPWNDDPEVVHLNIGPWGSDDLAEDILQYLLAWYREDVQLSSGGNYAEVWDWQNYHSDADDEIDFVYAVSTLPTI